MDRTTNIFGMPQRPLTASLVGTLLMLSVPTAQARQAATSFEELPVLLEVGDTINITDTMGRDVRGRLVEFSPSMLGLEVGSSRVYFQKNNINSIRERRSDSLWNGALWGLATGGSSGLLLVSFGFGRVQGPGSPRRSRGLVPVFLGAIGGIIGIAVDAAQKEERTVYTRGERLSISPVLGGNGNGVHISLRF